ncbi:hypothetical protein LTR62_007395 [Meristemomyces frigidus]|uniref:Uncharacterized protein n=1 Tax=Meristemomyces frigidus TaxID=1508187 RepID=A0AAN7YRL2_9PEZI|nr:hypothetical protein LTR62_007395 [Meristemomyces frigidus]
MDSNVPQPSGRQLPRRSSTATACSPSTANTCLTPLDRAEGSPVTIRTSRPQPVSADRDSGQRNTIQHDNACIALVSPPPPPYHSTTITTPAPSYYSSPSMSDEELIYEIYDYILENMEPNGADVSHYYEIATRQPPITAESLAELDMPRIINNPKLRHDVNFDRELHFRPNLEGSKGRQKMRSNDQYWQAVEGELFMYVFANVRKRAATNAADQAHWARVLNGTPRRLRRIFEAIRDILGTLVPDHEQKRVKARLDVDLMMQEIINGVCDLIDLSDWIATVVKKHCAPMRDALVDAMSHDIQSGARENDQSKLVEGLRQLLNVLEAMKLDVANHQIRYMRPLLVDDSIQFQYMYNKHRIDVSRIDVGRCQTWYHEEKEALSLRATETDGAQPTELDALTSALLRDLLFNETNPCPQSFYLDYDRLRMIRSDIRSSVSHELCRALLADLASATVSAPAILRAQGALQCAISAIVGMSNRFTERVANIAVEIVRFLQYLEGTYPPFDSTLLNMVELKLRQALNPASQAFDKLARDTCDRLLPKLKISIEAHRRLSALDLQDALVPATIPALASTKPFGFGAVCAPPPSAAAKAYDPDEDIVRRMTHIVCLHWHVWQNLIYRADRVELPGANDSELGSESSCSAASSTSASASPSPTIPIAHAVYAPGTQWLPVGVTVTEVASSGNAQLALPLPEPQDTAVRAAPSNDCESDGDTSQQEQGKELDAQAPHQPT